MDRNKKWFVGTLIGTFAVLIVVAVATLIIDPFFHYHKPLTEVSYILDDEIYQNPGIAKNFEYDSVVTGSSMTENFKPSYFKEVLGKNAVKLAYSGARSKNMEVILNKALASGNSINTIYLGLDLYMLEYEADSVRFPLPEYLYDNKYLNDVEYLFNKDVLAEYVAENIARTMNGESSTSLDEYSSWQNAAIFSQHGTLSSLEPPKENERTIDEAVKLVQDNLQTNVLPLIEANPKTKFVIFYPPYSMVYWYMRKDNYQMEILEQSIKILLPYENVELYFFQSEEDIVTNLYNYKDYSHYRTDINDYMVDCFANGKHRLTTDNYEIEIDKMKSLLENFDYGLYFGDSNPFITEDNYADYLELLDDERYIAFVAASEDEQISMEEILGKTYQGLEDNQEEKALGHVAVIKGKEMLLLETRQDPIDEPIRFSGKVEGMDIKMSAVKYTKNHTEINIDGLNYTTDQEGINIVVYDTKLQRVMDNIAVARKTGVISRR